MLLASSGAVQGQGGLSIAALSEALEKVGSVVKDVADGIEEAYKVGTFIVDDQKVRAARNSLSKVLAANNRLIRAQGPLLFFAK